MISVLLGEKFSPDVGILWHFLYCVFSRCFRVTRTTSIVWMWERGRGRSCQGVRTELWGCGVSNGSIVCWLVSIKLILVIIMMMMCCGADSRTGECIHCIEVYKYEVRYYFMDRSGLCRTSQRASTLYLVMWFDCVFIYCWFYLINEEMWTAVF